MRDLQYILSDCFQYGYRDNYASLTCNPNVEESISYMDIPISNEDFEIPVFALGKLNQVYTDSLLVVELKYARAITTYKALDTGVRDILHKDFKNCRLIKIPTKPQEPIYYGTYGAIFDKDFKPVVMLMWEVNKVKDEEGETKYKFIRPILRVHPSVFIHRGNSIERYIINKLIPAALGNTYIYSPYASRAFIDTSVNRFSLHVEINDFTFNIRKPGIPTISTTNEDLLKVALDNLNELVQ